MRKRRFRQTAISEFHEQLLRLIDEMEAVGHLLFYAVDEGVCRLSVNNGDEPIGIVKRYFPQASMCAGGGGSSTYQIPEFDRSIPDGYRGEAIVDEAKRFRFVDRARWVQIGDNTIFVWHGADRIEMYELSGLGHMAMLIDEEPTLELVQEKIAKHCQRHISGDLT